MTTPFLRGNKASGYGTLNTTNEVVPKESPMTENVTIVARAEETPMIESVAENADLPEVPVNVTTQSESEKPLVAIPTEELEFTWDELESLENACMLSGVSPRSGRRLVNV
eukprot:CAMPEP_0201730246 /NCGR_PEP_ID=MMETSP0593-20130828/21532_1 /ASSEMBLY_ACC=CAM_ASM_000672 /TAXON_ID=267983 /ORGANISM="Skeletonema japonicum, Strain CCMP2506" /LENGTH=110 /DNA_ID=CAMNT_0048222741 /DNA_START=92 /DNA_END=420 /DNA_ORIENTATION=+